MPDRDAYLQYKRDTNHLIYWIIHTSNRLSQTASATEPSPSRNITTSEVTVSTILSLSKIIAARVSPIPASIYRTFESVITARQKAYNFFQKIVTESPDPKVEESNARHKAFIDTLVEAFHALGGKTWKKDLEKKVGGVVEEDEEDEDTAFVNKYASLKIKDDGDVNEEEDEEDEEEANGKENNPPKRVKGKKGKKGKGKKKVPKKPESPPEPSFNDIPLESYKIVEEQSTVTDYLLAVYSIIHEVVELRNFTHGMWHRVVDGKLNSAAAGAMCEMAAAVVKQLQFEIARDFPGNGSYDAILNAITRGDPEKAQGMFHMGLWKVDGLSGGIKQASNVEVDVKECFMVHAYWDLLAFIQDFQKNRTGKPTKAMLAKLNNWDPNFNLKTASRAKRAEWRSAYTINWLYDLVVLWSSVVMQRKNGATTGKPQHFVLESEDWSADSKWADHRVLWGPLEFAADITALAMQRPSTDVKPRLLPHHVFQMQCIVDSFMIARGWTYYPLKGHVLSTPPKNYDPRLDIKHFQDRPNRGMNFSINTLLGVLEIDAIQREDFSRHKHHAAILPLLRDDLNIYLGQSKLAYGLNTLPPSRFSNTNSNGLWEYSPYLCGTGLADALEYVYNYGMTLWDHEPEPTAMLHLYNMLKQTGYIRTPIEVFEQCIIFFGETVFVGGEPPKENFFQAWKASCGVMDVMGVSMHRRAPRRTQIGNTLPNTKDIFSSMPKQIYKRKSLLALLKATNWRPEKIHDADLPTLTLMNGMRWMVKDQKARKQELAKSKSSGAMGLPGMNGMPPVFPSGKIPPGMGGMPPNANEIMSSIMGMQTAVRPGQSAAIPPDLAARVKSAMGVPDDYTMGPVRGQSNIYGNDVPLELDNRTFLEAVQRDVVGDIYGNICPLSGISYLHLLGCFMIMFMEIKKTGQHIKLIRDATDGEFKEPRITLTTWAMQSQDPQLLTFMAKVITNCVGHLGCGEFSYFPRFVSVWNMEGTSDCGADKYEGDVAGGVDEQCSVM